MMERLIGRFILVVAVVLFSCASVAAQKKPEKPTAEEIRALIEQLASRNPAPLTGESVEPNYKLRPGSDKALQKPVYEARNKLRELGPAAFPYLIERWDDKRYCLTQSDGLSGYCFNSTVGDICKQIVFNHLQPYSMWSRGSGDPRGRPKRPSYPEKHLADAKSAAKWCEEHQEKSLYEIQLLALDWVIAEEAKRPEDYAKEERAHLRVLRGELLKTKKLTDRGSYYLFDTEF